MLTLLTMQSMNQDIVEEQMKAKRKGYLRVEGGRGGGGETLAGITGKGGRN